MDDDEPALPRELLVAPFTTAAGHTSLSPKRLRSASVVRLTRGVYMTATEEVTHGRRIQAVQKALRKGGVLVAGSAAWAHGVRMAGPDDPVEMCFPSTSRPRRRRELNVCSWPMRPDEVTSTAMGPATTPARTIADLACTRGYPDGVGWVDAVLKETGVRLGDAVVVLLRDARRAGLDDALKVIFAADGRAESPRESLLRVLLLDAGLPRPVPQHVVRDPAGRFVARLDLAWPGAKVAVEYDGRHHRDARTHSRDLERHNRLRALGWTVLQVDYRGIERIDELVILLRQLLAVGPRNRTDR